MTGGEPLAVRLRANVTGAELYNRLGPIPFSAVLDPTAPNGWGSFALVAWDPLAVLRVKGRRLDVRGPVVPPPIAAEPIAVARQMLRVCRRARAPDGAPWRGGWLGYFAYDLGRRFERLPALAADDLRLPECYLGLYDRFIAIQQATGDAWIVAGRSTAGATGRRCQAEEWADRAAALVAGATLRGPAPDRGAERPLAAGPIRCALSPEAYVARVKRVLEYIRGGDVFQVNLSHRFEAPLSSPGWELYHRLCSVHPAPFGAYLCFPEAEILSISPECFLRVYDGRVETRPIKGTRPRGATAAADRALAQELLESAKDQAELVMIVDLARNDLGRVSEYGSVEVPALSELEPHPNVFHLVATVRGRLRGGLDAFDALAAAFPPGSVTGAPKVRAMQIIEELEPVRRGVYTGAIGWIDIDGCACLNVAIRTLVAARGRAYFHAGGGIVADSDPAAEYAETLAKARPFFELFGRDAGAAGGAL